jgi:replicative DNA helicase
MPSKGKTTPKKTAKPQADPEQPVIRSLEAEKAVLGSIFLQPDLYYEAMAASLQAEDFSMSAHRMIFQCIVDLAEAQVSADMISVMNYLEGQGWVEAVGDVSYMTSLIDGVPDRPSIKHYVGILKERTMRRKLQALGVRALQQAQDMSEGPKWSISGIQEDALAIIGGAEEKRIYRAGELGDDVLQTIVNLSNRHPDQTIGLPTFLRELDEITGGIRRDELFLCGGFPGSGKTSLALNIASRNAEMGTAVLIFSVEMMKDQLYERLLASHSEVPYKSIRRPSVLHTSEMRTLKNTADKMKDWPLYIDDQATHISEIIARSRLYIKKFHVELIMVDFVQIVDAPGEKEYERVSYVADALRDLAKRTHTPVFALSQLTRPDDKRTGKGAVNVKPNMMMLRSSGKLEQNAHVVLFAYHPINEETDTPTGDDLILIGKQRAGARGRARAYFNVVQQRWEEYTVEAPAPKQLTMAV